MGQFGIYHEYLNRLPAELSGGELQRAGIMRVLAVRPSLVVLDEVTSMLDSISQAQRFIGVRLEIFTYYSYK